MITANGPAGYEAARFSAAFFPVADGGRFRMLGPDAQDFLNRMVTNDVKSLTPGHGVYATIIDINGRMIADLYAWLLDSDSVLVETSAAAKDALMATLDKYLIMEQVEIVDASDDLALVTVQGKDALAAVARATNAPLPVLARNESWEAPADARHLLVGARARTALGGVDVYVPAADRHALLEALQAAGVEPGEDAALEILRVEAGIPIWGKELDETVIPLEANLEGVGVSFTKGCYPGQEIIARIHSRGKPARHLAGIRFPDGPPMPGAVVMSDGKPVGRITSAAVSPILGGLALAYLKKETVEPGAPITADGMTGIVTSLPFESI